MHFGMAGSRGQHKSVRTSHLPDKETDLLDHFSQENLKCSSKQSKDEEEEKKNLFRKRKMRRLAMHKRLHFSFSRQRFQSFTVYESFSAI